MSDKPILFSPPMVRELLAGTKTQTRRVLKPQPTAFQDIGLVLAENPLRIAVGDRLWVRETLRFDFRRARWEYCDSAACGPGIIEVPRLDRWPLGIVVSIHMPRQASRLTLTVTDVRVQRLQDISEADAVAEGCKVIRESCYVFGGTAYDRSGLCHSSPVAAYSILWDHINGAGSWDANPWVAVYAFTVARGNIDTPPPPRSTE